MSAGSLPQVRPYHPATFLERGVVIPFTTPLLAGTRARPAEKKGLELVIPNPSGGRGVYIMGWTGIAALCVPTLHDRQLSERIATIGSVTPSTIRRIAREVSAEGLAGEEAMASARAGADQDRGDRLVANYLLLMALVKQVNGASALEAAAGSDPVEVQRQARLTVNKIAPQLGRSTNWVAAALEAIADAMACIGINAGSTNSRMPRLVKLLGRCSTEIANWSSAQQSDDQASYAEMICSVADFTLTLAASTVAQARELTSDVVGLLRSWAVDCEPIIRLAARPEWLLDGWEQICLIWEVADDDAERRAALVEMASLVPVLPREVRDWSDLFIEAEASIRLRRLVALNEDWRTGTTVLDLIARNERLRALAG